MNAEEFLKDYWKRQLICLVYNKVEKDNLERNNIDNLHSVLEIMVIDDFLSFSELTIMDGERPHKDMLLILSPYNNFKYIEIDKAHEKSALEKSDHMINFLQLLGAKSISIENIKVSQDEHKNSIKSEGGNKNMGLKNDYEKIIERELNDKLKTSFKALPGQCEYKKALDYLKRYNLNNDSEFSNFIELRNPTLKNHCASFSREISYSEAINSSLDLVAKVNWPNGFLTFNYDKTIKNKLKIVSDLKIEFGNDFIEE